MPFPRLSRECWTQPLPCSGPSGEGHLSAIATNLATSAGCYPAFEGKILGNECLSCEVQTTIASITSTNDRTQLEDRQVHTDHHSADDDADDDHDERFQKASQRIDRIVDFLLVELGDLE